MPSKRQATMRWLSYAPEDLLPTTVPHFDMGNGQVGFRKCPACGDCSLRHIPILDRFFCRECHCVVYRSIRPWWWEDGALPLGGRYSAGLACGLSSRFIRRPPFKWNFEDEQIFREDADVLVTRVLSLVNLDQLFILFGGDHLPARDGLELSICGIRRGLRGVNWALYAEATPEPQCTRVALRLQIRDTRGRGRPKVNVAW